jgi:hypothetical protein
MGTQGRTLLCCLGRYYLSRPKGGDRTERRTGRRAENCSPQIANNGEMSLEQEIDHLYKGKLTEFVAVRTALAKTLTGDEARRVRRLQKPTVVPWAVNQLYWQSRPAYDRLAASGKSLRAAQVAALKGRAADVRRATEAHRTALAQAVSEAVRLSAAADVHPSPEELSRTLEAISLARDLPEREGRLTRTLQPAGFEALTGVAVKPGRARKPDKSSGPIRPEPPLAPGELVRPKSNRASVATERKRAAAERRKQREIEAARKLIARAKAAEESARDAWERAKRETAKAELRLSALQK